MKIPNTYMSFHSIAELTAEHGPTLGSPLVLRLVSDHGNVLMSIFMKHEDLDYTQRLIDAINGAAVEVSERDPAHEATHAAAHYVYRGSER